VIASPLYWYSVSAPAKNYLDHWSAWRRVPGFREGMRGRGLWGITVLSEVDRTQADPMAGMLRRTAAYMGMRWGGLLLGYGNRPGDVLAEGQALENARCFLDLAAGSLSV
jgi:multimeric flavodoxin WrbA